MVADSDSGKSVMSQVRTSSGTFLDKHQVNQCCLLPAECLHLSLVHVHLSLWW